jgi:ankyrin repeat protein
LYLAILEDKHTLSSVKIALKEFQKHIQEPSKDKREALNEAYKHIMERIRGQKPGFWRLSEQVLSWITFARRRLTSSELQHALAVEVGKPEFDDERMPEIEDMVSVCAGLVNVDKESDLICLTHRTTQEYLEHSKDTWSPYAHTDIAKTCAMYLSFDAFKAGSSSTSKDVKATLTANALYDYATGYWGHHVCTALIDEEQTALNHLDIGAVANVIDGMHRNILHLICRSPVYGKCDLIELFLSQGVCSTSCDVDNMTPFLYAVGHGREDIVDIFLESLVDVDFGIERRCWTRQMKNGFYCYEPNQHSEPKPCEDRNRPGLTMLHFSALNGDKRMAGFLLGRKANPNTRSDDGDTPLHLAVRRYILGSKYEDAWTSGDYAVEEQTLYITDYESEEASEIYSNIEEARIAVVDVLLESGVIDVNIPNDQGDYPLHVIPFEKPSSAMILSRLLKKEADFSLCNGKHQTCLHLASKAGNFDATRRLLDEGCDMTMFDADGLNALHYAVRTDRTDIVEFMLTHSQNNGSKIGPGLDHRGKSLLHHHVESMICSTETIRVLLAYGCMINECDADGNSVLGLYLSSFRLTTALDICQLLMKCTDPGWTNEGKENLAHLSMYHGNANIAVLELLLKNGVNITAKDAKGRSVVHYGAIHGSISKELIKFFRENGVLHLHDRDLTGKSPFDYAKKQADRQRPDNMFRGNRWRESFDYLKDATSNYMVK